MDDAITIETDMFEHREVKPHFINPCCFGEDFALWLKRELSPLADDGFSFQSPFKRTTAGVSGPGMGKTLSGWPCLMPVTAPKYSCAMGGFCQLRCWAELYQTPVHKPDSQTFAQLRNRVWQSVNSNNAISLIER